MQTRTFPLLVALVLATGCATLAQAPAKPPQRIVALGDSITAGHTYPFLVIQALELAKLPVPIIFNAGIGGDRSAGMFARLDRDVFVHHPDTVILSNAVNDNPLTTEEYRASMDKLIGAIRAKNIAVILCTACTISPSHGSAIKKKLEDFTAVIHELGPKHGCTVAEVYDRMSEMKENLFETDGVHLNFAGYRGMARAVLDAMGHKDLPVPTEWKVSLPPGVVPHWRIRVLAEDAPLTEESVKAIKPDDAWKAYDLPETEKIDHWWSEQQRQRGIAMSLKKKIGEGKGGFQAYAVVHADKPKQVFFNTGGEVGHVWVNGTLINPKPIGNGWHPGGMRIPVTLVAGDNAVVVETHDRFFLSVTDDDQW
jgi:lysophospholipase L1-like esterase